MFTQHPIQSEFFDLESFVDENISTLREMFDQAKTIYPYESPEWDARTAILVAAGVYGDSTEVKIPMTVDPDHQEGVIEMAQGLVPLMNMCRLEDEGKLTRTGNRWRLTESGKQEADQIMKKIASAESET